jgi:signal transduction histidine kinase
MDDAAQPTPARWPRPVDVAVVAVVLTVVILGTIHVPVEAGDREKDALAFLCGIVGTVALLFWRRWPLHVTGVVAVTTAVYAARNYPDGPALLPGPLALLALGYAAPRRAGWLGAAGYVAVTVVARLTFGDWEWANVLILVGWATAAVLAGQALAARGERAAAERERIAHQHEQAIATERLRIAQDVHDSVAHAMATINVQSGVAAHLLDRHPAQAKDALEAIRAASSDALDELGAILSVLRDAGGDAAPRQPVVSLRDVDDLVARSRADGLAVDVTVDGDLTVVPAASGAAAYRVIQEALTNTRRHAGPAARAEVAVTVGPGGELSVLVRDDGGNGTAPPPPVLGGLTGFGLVGMRERVESSGGTLAAGRRQGGGFEVAARWEVRR